MTWPPTLPPSTRGDLTVQQTNHPDDHNLLTEAIQEIIDRMSVQLYRTRAGLANNACNTATDYDIVYGTVVREQGFTAGADGFTFTGPDGTLCWLAMGNRWEVDSSGTRRVGILVNGVEVVESHVPAHAGGFTSIMCGGPAVLDTGDVVKFRSWHSANGTINLNGDARTFQSAVGLAG